MPPRAFLSTLTRLAEFYPPGELRTALLVVIRLAALQPGFTDAVARCMKGLDGNVLRRPLRSSRLGSVVPDEVDDDLEHGTAHISQLLEVPDEA